MKLYYQCDILPETDISETTYFCHNAFGVVINPNAIIEGTVIQHGVTIGELDSHEAPIIKENVYIGARAVVLNDIPPNCTAVGIPARIIRRGES